jgi:hypothetical protein
MPMPAAGAAASAEPAAPAACAPPPACEPLAPTYNIGDKVRIIGLEKRPELNGCLGQVVGPFTDGRYPVKLSEGGGLKVKVSNLRKGTPAAAGGPVPLRIDEEERKRIPLPRHVKKLLLFVSDPATSDGAKLECFKSLQGHAESQNPQHHAELLGLGVHTTMVRLLEAPNASDVVKGAAGGVLQNLALLDSNIDPLVDAGCVEALARRLAVGVHPLGRESAADCLLNLASTARGKSTIGSSTAALGGLVALAAEPKPTRPSAQATSMAVLGCCLQDAENWMAVVKAGGLRAAVSMLRRPDTTAAGRERAVGLCYILALALPEGQRRCFHEDGCLAALHEEASSAACISAKAQQTARECMAIFTQRGELTAAGTAGAQSSSTAVGVEQSPPLQDEPGADESAELS